MKKIILDEEELEIEKNIGKFRPVSREKRKQIEALIEQGRKSRAISLRINEADLELLKKKANRNGLPYQTMINVVIHKYVTDNFYDKDEISKILNINKPNLKRTKLAV